MNVKIITDSACDMKPEEARERGVLLLPLKTLIDGVEYQDGVTISAEEFYEKLAHCKKLPTTSQPSPDEFLRAYTAAGEDGSEVLVITISSKLSGTAQSARIAAEDFSGSVFVVDSESASVGERILLEYAIRLRDAGRGAADIARELNAVKKRICLLALVDTLEYLMRGGRLSRGAAIAGTVLNVKPVLGIVDGAAAVVGKARGARKSNNLLTETIGNRGGIDFSMPYMLAYSGSDDTLLRDYIENSRSLWENETEALPVSVMGSTIGTHAGPGAVVVAFFANENRACGE